MSEWRRVVLVVAVGALLGLTIQDLVQRARAHAYALEESRERYRAVVDSVDDVIFQTDTVGRFTFLNAAWPELLGYPAEKSLGHPALDFVAPEDRDSAMGHQHNLIAGEGNISRYELRYRHANGEQRWGRVLMRLLRDPASASIGTVGTLSDVTERKRAEIELSRTAKIAEERKVELESTASELAAVNRELEARSQQVDAFAKVQRDFVASAAHELRTPLTSIMGYVELVLEADADDLGETERAHLEIAQRNSQRLLALVEDLLTVNKLETGHLSVHPAPTAVAGLLHQTAETFLPICERRALTLVVEEPREPLAVLADRARIVQVIENLLGNAVKFTPPGGAVHVSARSEGDRCAFAISDTGIGIAAEELPHVFERFFRSASSKAMAVPGTGLGLGIAKSLVEAHDGNLEVESQVGLGTTFTLTPPVAKEAPWRESSLSTTTTTS